MRRVSSIGLWASLLLYCYSATSSAKCVMLWYDSDLSSLQGSAKMFPQVHLMYLKNLLGHFPHIQQYTKPIASHQPGDFEKCSSHIYLGTVYDQKIPTSFLEELPTTESNVLWAGYNIWQMPQKSLSEYFEATYKSLSKLDWKNKSANQHPSFYKYYEYKGEEFIKFGDFSKTDPSTYLAAFEIAELSYTEKTKPYILSWAKNKITKTKTPYVLHNRNFWYMADSPFSFITEDDRYLIASDLLFDVLDEEPQHAIKKALFRIEDIHPEQPLGQLYNLLDMLQSDDIPYTIALIPIFSDPLGYLKDSPTFTTMSNKRSFLNFLDYAKDNRASFVLHGITHQYKSKKNPHNAMSGDDFEFWNIVDNKPIDEDSVEHVVNKVQEGYELIEDNNIQIEAWEVPHYQASPLDYHIFGNLFSWNIGRFIYFPCKEQTQILPWQRALNLTHSQDNQFRLEKMKELTVSYDDSLNPSGQFFPYEIHGDVYGQRILPENIGNFQPFFSDHVPKPRTTDDLIASAKRNSVIRDAWASSFMHLQLLNKTSEMGLGDFHGDMRELQRFIQEIKKLGYEFVDLADFCQNQFKDLRQPTINLK